MKKILKLAVPLLVILAAFAVYNIHDTFHYSYSDIARHWAAEEIEAWSEKGVLTGEKGKFRPDDGMTVAELATVLTRVLPLEEMAENTFADVNDSSWYAPAVLKCVAAGILVPRDNQVYPDEILTRQDAFAMVARAFQIAPDDTLQGLRGFNDARFTDAADRAYVSALVQAGIVDGDRNVQLYPDEPITRAEVVALLEKLQTSGFLKM